jgi:DNA-binding LytR/AlgR family response regulator
MIRLKTIVVEDERLPRLTLLSKLEEHRGLVEVVDDCDSYESALESILFHRPDLLFLDIQLGGRDSISLLEELRQTIPLPYVIFTTAYSDREYLMSAIKLSAVDYLLKPIGKAELAHAIAKAADRATRSNPPEAPEKLSFKSVNSRLFLTINDIAGFKAEGNYATLISFEGNYLVLENLLSLEKRLQGKGRFLRADRSTIINVERVRSIGQHSCALASPDGRTVEIPVSNNGISALSAALETK